MNNSSDNVPQTVQSAVEMIKRRVAVKEVIGEILPQTRQSAVQGTAIFVFHGVVANCK
jgi:hypothetical protein